MFEKIAAKDMQYMDDDEEDIAIPNFGKSDSDLEVSKIGGRGRSSFIMNSYQYCNDID